MVDSTLEAVPSMCCSHISSQLHPHHRQTIYHPQKGILTFGSDALPPSGSSQAKTLESLKYRTNYSNNTFYQTLLSQPSMNKIINKMGPIISIILFIIEKLLNQPKKDPGEEP